MKENFDKKVVDPFLQRLTDSRALS